MLLYNTPVRVLVHTFLHLCTFHEALTRTAEDESNFSSMGDLLYGD